jgi:type IV pilus assembly protein PilF
MWRSALIDMFYLMRLFLVFPFLALALMGLTGCATFSALPSAKADLVTPSDETEPRKRARIRLELATAYFHAGKPTIALDEVKQSMVADPTLAEAVALRGLIYMQLNEPALAEGSFRKALDLNPVSVQVQHNFGLLLCQQGRMEEASRYLNAAIASPVEEERAKSWMILGLCQAKNKQIAQAESSLLKAYVIDPSNAPAAFSLSNFLFDNEQYTQSQGYVARLNQTKQANAESLWLGIKVARKLGDAKAVETLRSDLIQKFPNSKEAQFLERGTTNE